MSSLLPPSATPQELALEAATARIGEVPVPVGGLWHPAVCPAAVLPWLAWALSVDEWDASWPEETKRAVIAASLEVHARKGTVGAVKAALAAAGWDIELTEWWQQAGEPHTYTLDVLVPAAGLDMRALDRLEILAQPVQPARSHLVAVTATVTGGGQIPLWGAACTGAETTTLYPGS